MSPSRRVRITISRGAWLLVCSAAMLFALAALTNSVWPQLLGCVAFGLLVTSLLAVARPLRIEVTTRIPDRVVVGKPFETAIRLHNVSRRTARALVVRHSWPTSRTLVAAHATFVGRIDARGEVVVAMTRTPAARGVLSADEVRIEATSPFGLFSRTTAASVDRELVVLPALATIESIPANANGHGAATRGKGSDASGVREWRSGDQVRNVQWRSTARTGRLTVADDHVAPGSLVVLIAGRDGDPALEDAISKAATVGSAALRRGAAVFIAGDGGGCVRARTQASLVELLARAELREPLDDAALNRAMRCAADGGSVLVAAARTVSSAWAQAVEHAAALAGVNVVDLAPVVGATGARARESSLSGGSGRVRGHDRVVVLRRLDFAARCALLAAGLLAQWAMWIDAPAWVYPAAAVALVVLSAESARRPFVAPVGARFGAGSGRRRRNAYRIVAFVALAEICVGVIGTVPFSGAVPMAVPIGVLLLTVQGVQVQTIESRRDAIVGLFVVAAMVAAAGFFAHNASPAVAALPAVVMLLVAAALLQRGSVLARTRTAIGLPTAPVLRALFVPATTAMLIGAIAFVAMPNSLQLGTRTTIGHLALVARGDATTAGRADLDPGTARLDLRVRGALSAQPVFAVAAGSPSYWQGTVFDSFDGSSWTATGAATRLVTGGQPIRTDTVRVLAPRGLDVVMAPGTPTAYAGPGEMVLASDGTALLAAAGVASPWTYQVSSAIAAANPVTLRAATGGDPGDPKWTAVEPGLPARVRALAAQLTATAATRYDAVSAVDDYVRKHEVYDLTSPVPARGQDAVDDFLFVSHRGFCEQFASAAVVMLRSADIPARLVTGYSQGELTSEPGERVMRGKDAHAWVQVWYPGVGWVNSDPTAAAVLPISGAVSPAQADRHPLPLAAAMRIMPGGRTGWLVALVGFIAIVAGSALLLGVFRRRLTGTPRPAIDQEPRPGDGPVLQAYLRLDAALGGQAREPEQTLREVARQLSTAGLSQLELAAALDCLERECYAIVPPAPEEVVVAIDVFDRLHASLNGVLVP